jgi:hypothetical protein
MGQNFLKGSSATSAPTTTARTASGLPTGSATRKGSTPSPTVEGGYSLAGISHLPDPDYHAYRQDLADVALAGSVIASHYAEPLLRHLVTATPLRRSASEDAEIVGELQAGDDIWLLDDTRGWAWGYGGEDKRVGYVRAEALGL